MATGSKLRRAISLTNDRTHTIERGKKKGGEVGFPSQRGTHESLTTWVVVVGWWVVVVVAIRCSCRVLKVVPSETACGERVPSSSESVRQSFFVVWLCVCGRNCVVRERVRVVLTSGIHPVGRTRNDVIRDEQICSQAAASPSASSWKGYTWCFDDL